MARYEFDIYVNCCRRRRRRHRAMATVLPPFIATVVYTALPLLAVAWARVCAGDYTQRANRLRFRPDFVTAVIYFTFIYTIFHRRI